jgi:cellulose synthase/poly-beta-1,6-N-acetylglucosamine synthase-like glycosyltransferase
VEFIRHIDLLLFLLSGLILLIYYFYYLLPLSFDSKTVAYKASYPPVSLIIAYKNEYQHLKIHLDHWLAQDYPKFEIILVNDHSEDDGPAFLEFRKQGNIKLIKLEAQGGKKAAIQKGISEASYSHLLFTDADCKPMSSQWIKQMVKPMAEGKKIIVGYSGFYPKLSLLNAIQRYENCTNALQNASMIKKGRAYMAVGRNMAYQTSILRHVVSAETDLVLSGDDDLLVNRSSRDGNTEFVGEVEAQTISEASLNWSSYFFQRRRQLEAGKYYRLGDRLKLALLGISQLLFNLLFITHFAKGEFLSIILPIFVVKLILQFGCSYRPMKRLGEMDLWWQSPVLEVIYLPIISLIGISQYLYKVDRWK